jgi:hypothetical protein
VPGGYVVRDANGQTLAFVYSRDSDSEARQAKVLTKDEARRIAVNIARLPEFGKADRESPDWNAALVRNGAGHAIHPEIRSLREPIAQRERPRRPPQGHSEA